MELDGVAPFDHRGMHRGDPAAAELDGVAPLGSKGTHHRGMHRETIGAELDGVAPPGSTIEECIEGLSAGRSGERWRCSLRSIIEERIEGTGRSGARWRCSTRIHHRGMHRGTIGRPQCTRTPVLKANRHTRGVERKSLLGRDCSRRGRQTETTRKDP